MTVSGPRIVSLLPSCTEIVCALNCGDRLVARSHECDYPPWIGHVPVCTSAKLKVDAPSAAIDRDVKALLEQALAIYRVDADLVRNLKPDIIFTQAQCEVCAVSEKDVAKALAEWTGVRPQIVSLSPGTLAQVWDSIRHAAEVLGVPDRGKELLKVLKTRCVDVIERAVQARRRPSIACVEWIDPLMAAGNWVPDLVHLAAGENLFGESGKHSPWMKWEELVQANPEIIIVMPCGFDLKRTRQEMSALTQKPGWAKLRAVTDGKVFLTDGNQFFNRPGPRLVESLEILAELIHPEIFKSKHEKTGWERL